MQAAHTLYTYTPPYHQRCWLLNWMLGGLEARRTRCLWFPTRMTNLDSSDHRNFSTLKQSIINETWPTWNDGASGPWLPFCMIELYLASADGTVDCVYQQWFLKSFLGPFMSITESCRWVMQCHLRARRPRASNKGIWPCPLCTEIYPVSLNLLMMLCTVDDYICKAFEIWRWGTLFLKYSTICFTDWRASDHLSFWETLPL